MPTIGQPFGDDRNASALDPERLRRHLDVAHGLAERLPELLVAARRVSQTVAHGIHGRRRAGPGETFWQFRHFENSDSAHEIDWRRSANSDHLFIREREWEAAHTIWLWPDLSASMNFQSHLSKTTKLERALVLVFALAELLARGGERIGLLGMERARLGRAASERLAEEVVARAASPDRATSLPPDARLSRHSECILISDFLESIEDLEGRLSALGAQGVRGHLVQVLDPAEETLAYDGRTEFVDLENGERFLAERVEGLRAAYRARLAEHRARLADLATRQEWTFVVHHTDRPAEEILLALYAMLSGRDDDYRMAARAPSWSPGSGSMATAHAIEPPASPPPGQGERGSDGAHGGRRHEGGSPSNRWRSKRGIKGERHATGPRQEGAPER